MDHIGPYQFKVDAVKRERREKRASKIVSIIYDGS